MAFIPAPQVAEFVMRYRDAAANEMVNVYNVVHAASSWTVEDLQGVADILENWESAFARSERTSLVSLYRISCRDITTQFGNILEHDVAPVIPGQLAGAALPANVTFCLSYRTTLAGRSNRGRHYWIGLNETQVTGDIIGTDHANLIQTALRTLNVTLLGGAGMQLAIVSRQVNGVPRTTAQVTNVTNIFYTDTVVDTQRRRLPRSG